MERQAASRVTLHGGSAPARRTSPEASFRRKAARRLGEPEQLIAVHPSGDYTCSANRPAGHERKVQRRASESSTPRGRGLDPVAFPAVAGLAQKTQVARGVGAPFRPT